MRRRLLIRTAASDVKWLFSGQMRPAPLPAPERHVRPQTSQPPQTALPPHQAEGASGYGGGSGPDGGSGATGAIASAPSARGRALRDAGSPSLTRT
jgi:hypothetical protein